MSFSFSDLATEGQNKDQPRALDYWGKAVFIVSLTFSTLAGSN